MPATMGEGWTPERVKRLRKLIADGLPASQIARELRGVTRNAIVGKAHRLGLRLHGQPPKGHAPADHARQEPINPARKPRSKADAGRDSGLLRRIVERRAARSAPAANLVAFRKPAPPPPMPETTAHRVTFMELDTARCCHWVIGDTKGPDTLMCGAPQAERAEKWVGPYCSWHAEQARSSDARRSPARAA